MHFVAKYDRILIVVFGKYGFLLFFQSQMICSRGKFNKTSKTAVIVDAITPVVAMHASL